MKVIGFNASPRKNSNTSWVINKILKKANTETQFYNFVDLNIKPVKAVQAVIKTVIMAV